VPQFKMAGSHSTPQGSWIKTCLIIYFPIRLLTENCADSWTQFLVGRHCGFRCSSAYLSAALRCAGDKWWLPCHSPASMPLLPPPPERRFKGAPVWLSASCPAADARIDAWGPLVPICRCCCRARGSMGAVKPAAAAAVAPRATGGGGSPGPERVRTRPPEPTAAGEAAAPMVVDERIRHKTIHYHAV